MPDPAEDWTVSMTQAVFDMARDEADLSHLGCCGGFLLTVFSACASLYLLGWPWWAWVVVFGLAIGASVTGAGTRKHIRATKRKSLERTEDVREERELYEQESDE